MACALVHFPRNNHRTQDHRFLEIRSGIVATKPDLVLATPAVIKSWSESLSGLNAMQSLKSFTYIGLGLLFCAQFKAVKLSEEEGSAADSALYTHKYLVSESYAPGYTNTEVDGRPGCAVSDLLEPHPDNPALQRVYSRKDEQIWFSNRARMNRGPVEAHINRNPLVDAALVFGHGRTHPGVLIQLKEETRSDVWGDDLGCDACDGKQRYDVRADDGEQKSRIFDAVWASVEEGNQTLFPQFQIQRKMVVFATAEKPFLLTSKLQPRRRAAFEQYEEEISSAYS